MSRGSSLGASAIVIHGPDMEKAPTPVEAQPGSQVYFTCVTSAIETVPVVFLSVASMKALYGNRWLRVALTLVLVGLVVFKLDPGHLVAAAGSARPLPLLAAVVLTVPFLYLKAVRWHLMLR